MTVEEHLADMEIRIARQDDMLDALNNTVYRQQKKLDELESLCTALAKYVKNASFGDGDRNLANEKPPHY